MNKHSEKREMKILGIDLAKRSFHVHGVDEQGTVLVDKQLSRSKLSVYLANLPPLPGGDGGLWQRPLLGKVVSLLWA